MNVAGQIPARGMKFALRFRSQRFSEASQKGLSCSFHVRLKGLSPEDRLKGLTPRAGPAIGYLLGADRAEDGREGMPPGAFGGTGGTVFWPG